MEAQMLALQLLPSSYLPTSYPQSLVLVGHPLPQVLALCSSQEPPYNPVGSLWCRHLLFVPRRPKCLSSPGQGQPGYPGSSAEPWLCP